MELPPLLRVELERMVPAYGASSDEVLAFIVRHWLHEYGKRASEFSSYVRSQHAGKDVTK